MTKINILLIKLDYSFLISLVAHPSQIAIVGANFIKKDKPILIPDRSVLITNQGKDSDYFVVQKCFYKEFKVFGREEILDKIITTVIPNINSRFYFLEAERDKAIINQAIREFNNGDNNEKYFDVCLALANLAEYYPREVVSWEEKL